MKADARIATHSRSRSSALKPSDIKDAIACPLRQCRAPEMAAGDGLRQLKEHMMLVKAYCTCLDSCSLT